MWLQIKKQKAQKQLKNCISDKEMMTEIIRKLTATKGTN